MNVSKFAEQEEGQARRRIAANLRRLRTLRGLSQEAMAELANFHRTYVSQLERCVTNISIDGLERLALALHVDVQDLLAPVLEREGATGARLPESRPDPSASMAVHEPSPPLWHDE